VKFATREQDLTIAKTTLQFQELLIKNALTKNLDDPILEAMPVRPTDHTGTLETTQGPTEDMIARALRDRIELGESDLDIDNRRISQIAARNAVLPSVSLTAFYGGTGLAGSPNPQSHVVSTAPPDFQGGGYECVQQQCSRLLPRHVGQYSKYEIELRSLTNIVRSWRQGSRSSDCSSLKKQIRIEVRNAQYALEQSEARVVSARKGRDLAQKTFDITAKEQELGAGSNYQTLTAQRDLAVAESMLLRQ